MNKKINKYFYQPVLYFFLLPVISLIFGSFFAVQYSNIRLSIILVFYLYLLTNQFIERILIRIPKNDFEFSKKLLIALEIINFALILFFIWPYSLMAALTLFLYTIIIHSHFLFSYYDLDNTAALVTSLLKVIFFNGFAFYLQTQFIPLRAVLDYLPILIPYFLYERLRIQKNIPQSSFKIYLALTYLLALIALWPQISYYSLLFLLSSVFFWPDKKELEAKDSLIFLVLFSFLYLINLWIIFLLN